MARQTPLSILINERCATLGLSYVELGLRLGYTNPVKAEGRVKALCDNQLDSPRSRRALERLHEALEVPREQVDEAIAENRLLIAELKSQVKRDRRAAWEIEYEAWKARFTPHAVLITEPDDPSSPLFALSGGYENWVIIRPDLNQPKSTYIDQVVAEIDRRYPAQRRGERAGERTVPFLGRLEYFIFNYSPDLAFRFTIDGDLMAQMEKAYRPGLTFLRIGGRSISQAQWNKLILEQGDDD